MAYAYGVELHSVPLGLFFIKNAPVEPEVWEDTSLPSCPSAGSTEPLARALPPALSVVCALVGFVSVVIR